MVVIITFYIELFISYLKVLFLELEWTYMFL